MGGIPRERERCEREIRARARERDPRARDTSHRLAVPRCEQICKKKFPADFKWYPGGAIFFKNVTEAISNIIGLQCASLTPWVY